MKACLLRVTACCAAVLLGACADNPTTPGGGSNSTGSGGEAGSAGEGGGGAAGSGGQGNAGGEAGQGGGGGAGGGGDCGGLARSMCGEGEWCDYPDGSFCGGDDSTGVCTPKPEGCTADCPGVCGCDGTFYCNACVAQQAGVDVSDSTACNDL